MNREPIFDAVRVMLGRGFTNAEVRSLDDAIDRALAEVRPYTLANPAAFFTKLRDAFGPLDQSQVDGINSLLKAMQAGAWGLSWTAYGLATAWWETNKTMQPVEEAYYLGSRAAAYRKTLRYYPWHGRGYPQLTWERNYRWADQACGLNGALLADPSIAMKPEVAGPIMVKGMEQGAFTGKKLADFLPTCGRASYEDYKQARRIINGTDKAAEIAKIAQTFEAALFAGEA